MVKRFLDVCSGLGGFRIALESLGHKCVGFSEIDKYAIETYKENFDCKGELEIGDITKCEHLPEHDIICSGFPCQPFSMAGKRKGFLDERGGIFHSILDLAKKHKTQTLILENVKGLISINQGKTFKGMIKDLEDSGYKVSYRVICGSNVTLQKRQRVYIVADRDRKFDFDLLRFKKIHNKLSDILDKKPEESLRISSKLYSCLMKHKDKHKAKKNGFGFSVCNPENDCVRTISHRYHKDGSECLINDKEGDLPRKLSPFEMLKLFTFPESYKLITSRSRSYMLLGNSVIVDIVREIGEQICQNNTLI